MASPRPSSLVPAPIGIFDSGVGGLTVFREIARALPHHSLIYLGDSARVPYGTKSAETVTRYSLEAARHLLDRGIGMLVVACNTATAAALPALQSALTIPVIGVVEPGARAAVERTRGRVGVIATEGTVRSKAYTKAINKLDPKIEVIESAAPLFVSLAEEGWANTHVRREVAEIYLSPSSTPPSRPRLHPLPHPPRHDRAGGRGGRRHRRQRRNRGGLCPRLRQR